MIGGTILGRVGAPDEQASRLEFEIRPAGKGAPRIDPKPILDGWKLLEATAIYRASGRNVLHGDDEQGAMSIGQILLLPKPLLEKRVLADERIEIYAGGRDDIRSGQIDRRVLATLEYLAESGLRPTITSLRNGHGFYTASGNVSEHSSGNAVDIAAINGIPIVGHQDAGGITDQTVRRIMLLQGTIRPHQIISLLDYGQNTLALADHNDHIHVGFQPLFGPNTKLARQAMTVLEPRPVVRSARTPRRDRQPRRPHQALEVRNPGQAAPGQRRPLGRVARRPPPPSSSTSTGSSSSSTPTCSARRTAATSSAAMQDAPLEAVLVLETLGAPRADPAAAPAPRPRAERRHGAGVGAADARHRRATPGRSIRHDEAEHWLDDAAT